MLSTGVATVEWRPATRQNGANHQCLLFVLAVPPSNEIFHIVLPALPKSTIDPTCDDDNEDGIGDGDSMRSDEDDDDDDDEDGDDNNGDADSVMMMMEIITVMVMTIAMMLLTMLTQHTQATLPPS
jgi:hypothetical protein